MKKNIFSILLIIGLFPAGQILASEREDFNKQWKFYLGDITDAQNYNFNDANWRTLNLPHDWSVEGKFDEKNPATTGGGALPGGIGWYRKSFTIDEKDKDKILSIDFDGIYRNSEVWINGHYLGIRPFGYISFRYDLTPYLNYGNKANVIAVKVDNSKQPNSRWYSGSGIYRNVWLVKSNKIRVDHWGTFVTTPEINDQLARVAIKVSILNSGEKAENIDVISDVVNKEGKIVSSVKTGLNLEKSLKKEIDQEIIIKTPTLWSVENPYLYEVLTKIMLSGKVIDTYKTPLGIRYFSFDSEKGFLLNGKSLKINGVCNHHDLGCLGAAVNTRAIERQLEILKEMGCNGIRTSHNPPAPELLDLCDRMGFIVMDEAFDMWKKKKSEFDYSLYWDEWHKRDLEDMILRDRNHPSVFIWSIGNEILEQWDTKDSIGAIIARELTSIIKQLDTTRPITAACNNAIPENQLFRSGALDLLGFNYSHDKYKDFTKVYPGQKFIATETVSGLATRGSYDLPADTIRRWPKAWDKPLLEGNDDLACSSYDNCSAPWGSTHEETWKVMKKYDFLSGQFIWTGFDYIGEPTPYPWPARSSYFGIIDISGFPKDVYYMYQSEWTNKQVLHLLPAWNLPPDRTGKIGKATWKTGDTVDVWAYSNQQEVELFLNGKSLGTKRKGVDDLHLSWKVPFHLGSIKAIGRSDGKEVMVKEIKTAGEPVKIILTADRSSIKADGYDLSFITVKVVDKDGNLVPYADNQINFSISGEGFIAGVDNGSQVSMESFKASQRKAFKGMCLVVVQNNGKAGNIVLKASSENLGQTEVAIKSY